MKKIMQKWNIKNRRMCSLGLDSIELGMINIDSNSLLKSNILTEKVWSLLPNQRLQSENRYLRQPNEVLKEYNELERNLIAKLQSNLYL